MSPSVRREAVEVLFGRREGIEAVIVALESRALQASDLDPARLEAASGPVGPVIACACQKIFGCGRGRRSAIETR